MPKAISNTMSKAAGRASPQKGSPGRNPMAILKSENGDVNYFSTVVFIFIAVLLLAFILDLFSIISTKPEALIITKQNKSPMNPDLHSKLQKYFGQAATITAHVK